MNLFTRLIITYVDIFIKTSPYEIFSIGIKLGLKLQTRKQTNIFDIFDIPVLSSLTFSTSRFSFIISNELKMNKQIISYNYE